MRLGNERMPQELLTSSPETITFSDHFNHFDVLPGAAEVKEEEPCEPYEMQNILKQRLLLATA